MSLVPNLQSEGTHWSSGLRWHVPVTEHRSKLCSLAYVTALQLDNKLHSTIHTIKQVMQLCEYD